MILYTETLIDFQLAPVLAKRGIIPGVRADTDGHPLPISPSEPATQGLDDLLPRLQAAYAAGARFTKWRAPILCTGASQNLPSQAALEAQAENLARFAAISQQAGLVPIVEPDVDFGADANLKKSVEIHVKIISMIYARCAAYGVLLEGKQFPVLYLPFALLKLYTRRFTYQTILRPAWIATPISRKRDTTGNCIGNSNCLGSLRPCCRCRCSLPFW